MPPKKKNIPLREQRRLFESNLAFLHILFFERFKNREYVFGIDPSLNNTSIAFSKIGRKKKIEYYDSPEEIRDLENRIKTYKKIALTRKFIIEELKKHPAKLVTIEGYAFSAKLNRELMGEVGGMIRLNVFYDNPDLIGCVIIVGPTQLKKYILGSAQVSGGKKTKELIIKEVFKRFRVDVNNNNLADAVVLMRIAKDLVNFVKLFGRMEFKDEKHLRIFMNEGWKYTQFPKYRWEVLVKLIWSKGDSKNVFDFRKDD